MRCYRPILQVITKYIQIYKYKSSSFQVLLLYWQSATSNNIHSVIWKDVYPKKIKIFLWELSLGATNMADHLQGKISHFHLSPSWCVTCSSNLKQSRHLFVHCPFAFKYWVWILDAFGWSLPLPNNIYDILASIFVGHPFHGTKKTLWPAFNRVFLWFLWGERNGMTFRYVFSNL